MAAGHVVEAFGKFVAGDRPVIGIIIFIIIVVIQFIVITKGATRISEVAARFALTVCQVVKWRSMPILTRVSSTNMKLKNAAPRSRSKRIFFGAMDGASKFVRGDAIAGILITLINIVGGFIIGVVQGGMTFTKAAEVFTKLTIGDGLVSQVPAFLISLAAGLIVTRLE